MNKQAITFLSLFSLILVLSIYYVMLPPTSSNDDVEIVNTNNTMNYEFEQMESDLLSKRNEETTKNNDIIASSSSTTEEISAALKSNQEIKDKTSIEEEIKNLLISNGYESVFCEISGDTIKVTIGLNEAKTKDATEVISLVLSKTTTYTPEVKFVELSTS